MRPTEELIERCRAAGMRITGPRKAIFDYLEGNTSHPTAEEIFRAVQRRARGVSLATVYNTLETLQALGEIGRHRLDDGGDRFDPEIRPHHHFRCKQCGRVMDAFGEVAKPKLSGLSGCEVEDVELVLSGRCERCKQTARPSRQSSKETRK